MFIALSAFPSLSTAGYNWLFYIQLQEDVEDQDDGDQDAEEEIDIDDGKSEPQGDQD